MVSLLEDMMKRYGYDISHDKIQKTNAFDQKEVLDTIQYYKSMGRDDEDLELRRYIDELRHINLKRSPIKKLRAYRKMMYVYDNIKS